MRVAIQARQCSKLWLLWWSWPHRKARHTQRETQWCQGVAARLMKDERGGGYDGVWGLGGGG